MNRPNIIAVPTQDVLGYKPITNIPVPLTRWLAIKAAIRASTGAPWLIQQLASAALGVSASTGVSMLYSSGTDRDKLIMGCVAVGSFFLAVALYTGVRQQRKLKEQHVTSIIESMDAVEEPFNLPHPEVSTDPSLRGRFRAAIDAFKTAGITR